MRSRADRIAFAMGMRPQFRRMGMAEIIILGVVKEGMVKAGFAAELNMTVEGTS